VLSHDRPYGLTAVALGGSVFQLPTLDAPPGASLRLRIRARDVMIATRPPAGLSALNIATGRILSIDAVDPTSADLRLDCSGDILLVRVTRRSVEELGLSVGRTVFAVVKAVSFRRLGGGEETGAV
jgi:molybdate transport system ATP-binding protein